MKLFKTFIRAFVPTFQMGGGGGGEQTSKVIYDKDTKAARADSFKRTKDYLEKYANVSDVQKGLNSWQEMNLNKREGEINDAYSNSDWLSELLLNGDFNTNFDAVDNSANPIETDFEKIKGETASASGANWLDALLTQSPDYQAAIAQNSPEYQNANAQFLSDYSPISATTASPYQGATAQGYDASTADLSSSFQKMGAIDPTQSLQSLLTGKIDNPYLSSMHQAYINDSMRGYGDAVQKLNQETMPNINSEAFAAGQYGGSRQGIAQGLALQQLERNARDLGIEAMDSGNQLYGNAYTQAQQNMATTANNLAGMGIQSGQFNAQAQNQAAEYGAAAQNQASQFNAGNAQQQAMFDATNANQMGQFNATNDQANQKYNADFANQMAQFNSSNLLNKNQFDTTAQNQMTSLNANNLLNKGQFDATQANSLNLANSQGAANVGMANANNATTISSFNAGQLNDLGLANSTNQLQSDQFDSTNMMNNGQFNANLGLENNKQQIAQTQQNLQNGLTGLNTQQTGINSLAAGQDALYTGQSMLANYDKNYALDLLDVSRAGASMSPIGSTSSVTGGGNNVLGQLGGTALAGTAIYNMAGGNGIGGNWFN
ncbi:MAG: hypothetical protein WBI40_13170 [Methylococcaceae bacterium]